MLPQSNASAVSPHKTARMVNVALVADRPNHKDNLYSTETVWAGKGDVKAVPESLWPKFAQHSDVYAKVDGPVAGDGLSSGMASAPAQVRAPTFEEIAAYVSSHPELLAGLAPMAPTEAEVAAVTTATDADVAAGQAKLRAAIAEAGVASFSDDDAEVRALAAEAGISPLHAKLTSAALRAKVVGLAKATTPA